jgi:hypothetical protein
MRTRVALVAGMLVFAACGRASADSAEPSLIPNFYDAPSWKQSALPPPSPVAPPLFNPFAPRRTSGDAFFGASGRPYATVGARLWLTSGSLNTRDNIPIPPQDLSNPNLPVSIGETRSYDSSGNMLVASAEVAPLSWLSFEAEYGSDRTSGSYQDQEWINAPEGTLTIIPTGAVLGEPTHEDDLVYGADNSSFRDWFAATMYVRVIDAVFKEDLGMTDSFDIGVGAERYRQNSDLTNLSLNANNNYFFSPGTPTGPIPGYVSTYQGYWQGPHFALREEFEAKEHYGLQALILYSPFLQYSGAGFDNLSVGPGGLRAAAPNYQDFARGTAIHFAVTATWTPLAWLRFEAGYQRLYFYTGTGTRRYYNFDGASTDVQLDYATANLQGVIVGASLRY